MQIKNAKFITSVAKTGAYVETQAPQIAIVGKSNVGKSRFINAICNHYKLARTSAQPGKTRLINYFAINGGAFYFVDLPGYGFARAPKSEKQAWGELIEGYLRSGSVTHIFLLLDSRHSPTQEDKEMLRWIEYYSIPYTILATKIDKIAKSKRGAAISALHREIGAISPALGFSAVDKSGKEAVLFRLEQIICDVALHPRADEVPDAE